MTGDALKTVILAGHDRLIRLTLREVLQGEGWTLVGAGPAADVLERATEPPGLAVVELSPTREAEGFCVGMRIRYGPQVPILGVSGVGERRTSDLLTKPFGPCAVLHLPFDVAQLQSWLARVEGSLTRSRELRATSEDAVGRLQMVRGAMAANLDVLLKSRATASPVPEGLGDRWESL